MTTALRTPDRDLDRTISHLLATVENNAGHLDVHTAAAQAAKDPALITHHLRHAAGHAGEVSSHLVKLRDAVSRRLPAVAGQLDDLARAVPGSRSIANPVPPGALDMSIAHDLASSAIAAAHVGRHLAEAQAAQSAGNRVSVAFNIEHAVHHIAEIGHHLSELDADLDRSVPAVARETQALHAAAAPGTEPAEPDRSAPADYDVSGSWPGPEPA